MKRILLVVAVLLMMGVAAQGADYEYRLYEDTAALFGATGVWDVTSGAVHNSYWRVGEGFWLTLEPAMLFGPGATITIDDIERVEYRTRTGPTTANVDVAFQFYTNPGSDPNLTGGFHNGIDDASWYQRLLKSEPLYSNNYDGNFPDNTWNTFATDHAAAPMLFYDGGGHTYAGFYTAPTLGQVQGADYSDLWNSIPTSGGDATSYNYGNMTIKSFVLATSSGGNWAGFEGDLDYLRIELFSGDTATVHFDATPELPAMALMGLGTLPLGLTYLRGRRRKK